MIKKSDQENLRQEWKEKDLVGFAAREARKAAYDHAKRARGAPRQVLWALGARTLVDTRLLKYRLQASSCTWAGVGRARRLRRARARCP
eukprot:9085072-Pyramimonas_sp.AAC.2